MVSSAGTVELPPCTGTTPQQEIECLEKQVALVNATLEQAVNRIDAEVKKLQEAAPGGAFKLGFDTSRCLAFLTGEGGTVGSPPFEVQRLVGLQDCGGAPPVKINP
jgi:hypothetical protein